MQQGAMPERTTSTSLSIRFNEPLADDVKPIKGKLLIGGGATLEWKHSGSQEIPDALTFSHVAATRTDPAFFRMKITNFDRTGKQSKVDAPVAVISEPSAVAQTVGKPGLLPRLARGFEDLSRHTIAALKPAAFRRMLKKPSPEKKPAPKEVKNFIRLHFDLPPAGGNFLCVRLLVRVISASGKARVKPYLVASRVKPARRRKLPGCTPRFVDPIRDQWCDVSGVFACSDFGPDEKINLVLELPGNGQVDLAGLDLRWLDADVSPEAAEACKRQGVITPAGFRAFPVADPVRALREEPVFAAFASREDGPLSGGVIMAASSVYLPQLAGAVALDQLLAIAPGVKLRCGFRIPDTADIARDRFPVFARSPDAIPDIPLEYVETNGGIWQIASYLQISNASIRDFTLRVSGVIVNPKWPGMPVRLQVRLGGETLGVALASTPSRSGIASIEGQAFEFTFAKAVPESLTRAALTLEVLDTGVTIPVFLRQSVARIDSEDDVTLVLPAGSHIIGSVDAVTRSAVDGWALCPEQPDYPVELVLYLNDAPFAYTKTRRYRKDVQDIHGGSGHAGYSFDLPPNMAVLQSVKLEVRPLGSTSVLKDSTRILEIETGHCVPTSLPPKLAHLPSAQAPLPESGRISVIILNRNGRDLLNDMFASVSAGDRADDIEWIVVDHDSSDDSAKACDAARAAGLSVTFLARRGNYSFSESNNFGVRHASGDILVFANNDLIFTESFGSKIRHHLADPGIGALGARLLDHIDSPGCDDLLIDQHLGVFFDIGINQAGWIRPYEGRRGLETPAGETASRAAAVTGAFLIMRRADFDAVRGFDEGYSYGLEDIDLCLKVRAELGREVVCANDIAIIHHRGFSRNKDSHSASRRRQNHELFNQRWGVWLRRSIKRDMLSDYIMWTGRRPVIAFIVTEVGDKITTGDFHTSLEMGRALQKQIPCHVRYLPKENWSNLEGVDLLVTMVNNFELSTATNGSPWLVTANWMRQWFDRWVEADSTPAYDHLFASSATAATYMEQNLGCRVENLPIAAGSNSMMLGQYREELASDYCFTGSRFGPPREIEFQLDPASVEGRGKVFGYNWEGTAFEPISAGALAYSAIPDAYASTRIVLDDANIATKIWGSCNSRVFDAMAAGVLLVTNGATGSRELFGDLVPTFDSKESLTQVLNYWLTHEPERKARVAKLQDIVRREHNYDVRASSFLSSLKSAGRPARIAIKCAARYAERAQWGDYHYAKSLADALRRQGHIVRVDCRDAWDNGLSKSDDVAIVLRGLVPYVTRPHQLNIMWLISHPDDVKLAEMRSYQHVYVASEHHAKVLADDFAIPASFLPQCTDITRFRFEAGHVSSRPERNLYVANSRGVFRDPVRWSIRNELSIDIYGGGWEPFITDSRFRGKLVPNEVLGEFYASSRLVICDHWDDMRALGYVSNRVFDVLGCGGRLICDRVVGLEKLVPPEFVEFFDNEEDFVRLLSGGTDGGPDLDQRRRAAEWVAEHHSFDARAREISTLIEERVLTTPRGV